MKCLGASSNLEPIETALHQAKDELSSQIQTGLSEMVGTVNSIVQRTLNLDTEAATTSKRGTPKEQPPAPMAMPTATRSSKRTRNKEEIGPPSRRNHPNINTDGQMDETQDQTKHDQDQKDQEEGLSDADADHVHSEEQNAVAEPRQKRTTPGRVRSSKRVRDQDEEARPTEQDRTDEEEDKDQHDVNGEPGPKTEPRQTRTRLHVTAKPSVQGKEPAKPLALTLKPKLERHPAKKTKRLASSKIFVDLDEDRIVNRNDPPFILKAYNNETVADVADLLKVDVGSILWLNPGLNKYAREHQPLNPGTTIELPFVDTMRWKNVPRIISRLVPNLRQASDKAIRDLQADEEEYSVEKILRSDMVDGVKQYYVRWKGYGENDDTWEPATNLQNCPRAIADYEKMVAAAARGHV